jgi:mono/diheme cytochrome c family protein
MIANMATVAGSMLAACTMAGCGDWPWRHDMADQPSRPIATESRAPVGGTMPVGTELPVNRENAEKHLRNPLSPASPTAAGRALYDIYCVPCHGASGAGDGPVSAYFGAMPDLTGPDVQKHGDAWLYATITDGTEHMPRYAHELTPDERWQIVHFLRRAGEAK